MYWQYQPIHYSKMCCITVLAIQVLHYIKALLKGYKK